MRRSSRHWPTKQACSSISIGITLLHDRHQRPEDLRADATEALREAYETGTCTILE